jgi:hypothetical protein
MDLFPLGRENRLRAEIPALIEENLVEALVRAICFSGRILGRTYRSASPPSDGRRTGGAARRGELHDVADTRRARRQRDGRDHPRQGGCGDRNVDPGTAALNHDTARIGEDLAALLKREICE